MSDEDKKATASAVAKSIKQKITAYKKLAKGAGEGKGEEVQPAVLAPVPKPKKVPTLLKSRPYAEVWGTPGVRYLQDGKFFNHAGDWVNEDGTKPEVRAD